MSVSPPTSGAGRPAATIVRSRWRSAPKGLGPDDIGCVAPTLAHPISARSGVHNRGTGLFTLIDDATRELIAARMVR